MTGSKRRDAEKSWGTRVAERRFEVGMTQEQLAALIKRTQQSVSRIEANTVTPKIGTMRAIAAALGTTMDELFPWESSKAAS